MKNLKKIAYVTGRAALFIALTIAAVSVLYRLGAPHYEVEFKRKTDKVLKRPKYVKAIVVGNSHARAIRLGTMGYTGENFGDGGQDMFESAYIVERLLPRLSRLKVLFAVVSFHTFFYDNDAFLKNGVYTREGKRIDLYAQFPISFSFIKGDMKNYLKGTLHPVITKDHWERVLGNPPQEAMKKVMEHGKGRVITIDTARQNLRNHKAKMSTAELRKSARDECQIFTQTVDGMRPQNPNIPGESFTAAMEMTKRLMARGVRMVFTTPPYYRDFHRCSNKRWKQTLRDFMARIARETGAEYYDHSGDKEFLIAPEAYANADHLNTDGADLFSLKLKSDMERSEKKR